MYEAEWYRVEKMAKEEFGDMVYVQHHPTAGGVWMVRETRSPNRIIATIPERGTSFKKE